jgi:hypothetical protein
VACRAKWKLHSTEFLEVLRDSGDEPDGAEIGKAPRHRIIIHQGNKAKTKQNAIVGGTPDMEEIVWK